jgi:hypothetical protein
MDASATTAEQLTVQFSPAAEMNDAYRRMKEKRIRVSVARSTRAGSIGNQCERFIYYERTVPATQRVPHSVGLQEIFDLGNALEPWIVREIEDAGFEIVGRQKDWYDDDLEIGARGDVRVHHRGWPRPVVCEIKGLSPFAVEKIREAKDIRDHHSPWVRRYYDQGEVYLRFDGGPVALFALANKLTGHVEFIDLPRDAERIAMLEAKAARIRDAVRAKVPPPRHETEDCARCPFLQVCMPDRLAEGGVTVLEGALAAEASDLIARRLELAAPSSEYEAIGKRLKALLPEQEGELLAGEFVVIGKRKSRAAYTAPASSWIERKYLPVVKGGANGK